MLGAQGGILNNGFVTALAGLVEFSIKQLSLPPFAVAWETLQRWVWLGLVGLLRAPGPPAALSGPSCLGCALRLGGQPGDSRSEAELVPKPYPGVPTDVQAAPVWWGKAKASP